MSDLYIKAKSKWPYPSAVTKDMASEEILTLFSEFVFLHLGNLFNISTEYFPKGETDGSAIPIE